MSSIAFRAIAALAAPALLISCAGIGDKGPPAVVCDSALTRPEGFTPLTPDAALTRSQTTLANAAARKGAVKTTSGLVYEVLTAGPADGAPPTADREVRVHYTGCLADGFVFDSSLARGEPAVFPVGALIPAWVEALQLMKPGDKWRLTSPPDLAYGESGAGPDIGPNEALIFEMELLEILPLPPTPAQRLARSTDFIAEIAQKPGVIATGSGLLYEIVSSGPAEGKSPKAGELVTVHYEGKLADGKIFDSSYLRGQPATFPSDRLIPGWVEALQLMKPGDVWMLYIPPALGYGERGAGGAIGPNEALVFKVEMISVGQK